MTITLTIKKLDYSANPWRICINENEWRYDGFNSLSFPRKRDAKPTLEALLAIGDWSQEFSQEQRGKVVEIIKESESFKSRQAVLSRTRGGW